MSNALSIIQGTIEQARAGFMSVLTDRSLNFEREAGFAIQILSAKEYTLSVAKKNPQSVIDSVTNVAAIGVSLNPAKKQAYLVPRNGNICLDISYIGLLDLAIASGSIMWGQSELVRQNDVFQLNGFDKLPTHNFNPFAKMDDRGPVVGVYVVVKTRDGDYLTTCMSIDEVHAIRDRSEGWKAFKAGSIKSTPWSTDEGEMTKKTVIKRAYKLWPKTDRLDQAIHFLNTEGGEGLGFEQAQPLNGAPRVDVAPMIAEALATTTDADALAYWRENNARLINQPQDHKRLKDVIMAHRTKLQEAARTVEMPAATQAAAPSAPQVSEIPPELEGLIADLEAAADGGTESFESAWNSLSKASRDKITNLAGVYDRMKARAEAVGASQ